MTRAASQPVVSVLVTTVGQRRLLAHALASVQAQTFEDFSVHVLNDGGPSVRPVIDGLRDSRFMLEEFATNRGKAAMLNHGLRRASGRYVAYLDDDDEYLPDHLEVLLDALRRPPSARWAYADTIVRYHRPTSRTRAPVFTEIENESDVNFPMLYWANRINHKNAIHERSLAVDVGGYDENAQFYIDWEIFLKMSAVSSPRHVRRVTSIYYRPLFATGNKTFHAHRDAEATAQRVRAIRRGCIETVDRTGPLVSLLIAPADDRRAMIATTIGAVENSAHRPLEVVMPSASGLDALEQQLDAWSLPWRRADTDGHRGPLAFNTLATAAQGDVLALVRPGHTLLPGWLRAALPLVTDPHAGLVGSLDLDGQGTWTRRAGLAAGTEGLPSEIGAGWVSTDPRLRHDLTVPAIASWTTCVTRSVFGASKGFDPGLPDVLASVELSLRVSDMGLANRCSVGTVACETMPGTAGWPMLPAAVIDSYRRVWQGRASWASVDLPSSLAPQAARQSGSDERPYRVIDPTTLGRAAARARRILLFGTARVEHVEAVAGLMRTGAADCEIDLFSHASQMARLTEPGWFHRRWEFHCHRVHLSLLPEALVARVARRHYDFAVVAMNGSALADYGHVFALARLVKARPRFAVTPPVTVLALDSRLTRLRGAWHGTAYREWLSCRPRMTA